MTYAVVPYPWRAAVDLSSSHPSLFYAGLIGQAMRYTLPTRRRFGAIWGLAARRRLRESALSRAFAACPRRPRPDLDALVDQLQAAWPAMAERSPGLVPWPRDVAVLALERRAGLTVFVFGDRPDPLIVLKIPSPGHEGVEREVHALEEAAATELAPRYLGRVGDARAQQALAGRALQVDPVTPENAHDLVWGPAHAELAAAFVRLAGATSKPQTPTHFALEIERALNYPELAMSTRRLLTAAWRDVSGVQVSCLGHGDASPQNCLYVGDRLSGLVDWERAQTSAVPGFDTWNCAVSSVVLGVGLARWSQQRVVDAFSAAWRDSSFFEEARVKARRAALTAGHAERHLDALEIAFFGYRLDRRLRNPHGYPTSPETAVRMLELACAD